MIYILFEVILYFITDISHRKWILMVIVVLLGFINHEPKLCCARCWVE